ncbi:MULTISPECIES: hypothetical protein [Paenibacillus]|uniref:hypothetical protein n=1 Tax=Paenibacillus TaxID=44249 RepID=UPI00048F7B38|nr:hypothetical protein [Paenibacillus sp. IHBB 10380]
MDLVFNELSLRNPFNSITEARVNMREFVLIIQEIFNSSLGKDLRVAEDFLYLSLAADYKLIQWLNDSEVDREIKRFFKSRISRKPYIDTHNESHLYNDFVSSEFQYNGVSGKGLGIAFLLDGAAISLFSQDEWNTQFVNVNFVELDKSGELFEEEISIRHICVSSHLAFHKPYFEERKLFELEQVDWRNSLEELFPSLVFCERTVAQLFEYGKGEHILKQIKSKLIELNEYFSSWEQGGFDSSLVPFKVTPESQRTLEHCKREHTFLCPDGQYRVFSWHLRMTPGAGRIFFIPDVETRKCIIGHIGNKLKTVSDPT